MSTFYEREERARKLYEDIEYGTVWPSWVDLDERTRSYYLDQARLDETRDSASELRNAAVDSWAIPFLNWITRTIDKLNGRKPR